MIWAASIGCHSAIVVLLGGSKYLVDVGLPLYAILPLREGLESTVESHLMRYTAKPLAEGRFEIWRSVPRDECVFQLIDEPVGEAEYRAVTLHDYRHDGGQFLNEVVIRIRWLTTSCGASTAMSRPWVLQAVCRAAKGAIMPLETIRRAELAAKFGIARQVVAEAMRSARFGKPHPPNPPPHKQLRRGHVCRS